MKPRYYYPVQELHSPVELEVDVCVYGGTSGGVTTAVHAARLISHSRDYWGGGR